jgi:hypothetical protein
MDGCSLSHTFIILSFLVLVILPELHISDKRLVEVGEGASASPARLNQVETICGANCPTEPGS